MIDLNKNSFCLTCNINRYRYLCKSFNAVGLESPKLFPGVHHPISGQTGCILGHIGIIMLARCLYLPYVIVFEDDAYPRQDVIEKFNEVIRILDDYDPDWGMLSLGRNGELSFWDKPPELFWTLSKRNFELRSKSKVKIINNYLINIPKNPNGSHAYVIKKNCYNEWLHSLCLNKFADIAMGSCNFHNNRIYWTKELLFVQKQIDKNCMTQLGKINKDTHLFIYPDNYNKDYTGIAEIFNEPPNGFVKELAEK